MIFEYKEKETKESLFWEPINYIGKKPPMQKFGCGKMHPENEGQFVFLQNNVRNKALVLQIASIRWIQWTEVPQGLE